MIDASITGLFDQQCNNLHQQILSGLMRQTCQDSPLSSYLNMPCKMNPQKDVQLHHNAQGFFFKLISQCTEH